MSQKDAESAKEKTLSWAFSITGWLILFAALPMPFEYYQFIRVAAPLGIVVIFLCGWNQLIPEGKFLLILIATLFNPIEPLYFGRSLWIVVDLVSAIYIWTLGARTVEK